MKLNRIQVKNFRLLRDVEVSLASNTTVVVGKNNCGKTSFAEVIRRFTNERLSRFELRDFSSQCAFEFANAFEQIRNGTAEHEVRKVLPFIEVRLFFKYDTNSPDVGPLSPFIIDLNEDCDEALVVMRYEAKSGQIDDLFSFNHYTDGMKIDQSRFLNDLSEGIPKHYSVKIWAEDPNDRENKREATYAEVENLLHTGFINAQRGLDDVTTKDSDVLAKVLEELFNAETTTSSKAPNISDQLTHAVASIQNEIDGDFKSIISSLLPSLKSLGYPGLGGTNLTTETKLDVRKLLSNHTKVRYEGSNGMLLPEAYNGLGMRNLIYILLQVVAFHRKYRNGATLGGLQILVIEEPEAHLHPQMQEVFIRQLDAIVDRMNDSQSEATDWPIQFIVSTHSSHIANEAKFEAIRYFTLDEDPLPDISSVASSTTIKSIESTCYKAKVKDLSVAAQAMPAANIGFLHQYLTQTRCDLFFADKAILIEGTCERLLLPVMCERIDELKDSPPLRSQYISTIEVGGAYAHIFIPLVRFLELPTLIITDIDPVDKPGGKKCYVHNGANTSNACIKSWFDDKAISVSQLQTQPEEKLHKDSVRLTYQCSEQKGGPCGRTFEDAFILANPAIFSVQPPQPDEAEKQAAEIASKYKKTTFALRFAVEQSDWETPKYIVDGLIWLAKQQLYSEGLSYTDFSKDD